MTASVWPLQLRPQLHQRLLWLQYSLEVRACSERSDHPEVNYAGVTVGLYRKAHSARRGQEADVLFPRIRRAGAECAAVKQSAQLT
jgi:hypothetical protein